METDASKKPSKIPWSDEISKTIWYTTYMDTGDDGIVSRYVFLIKDRNGAGIPYAMHSCHQLGSALMSMEGWLGYVISLPVGESAGQEIEQLYIELKPVR